MHKQMAKLHSALSSAISGATPERLSISRDGKWSAAEILEHLNLTYLGTIKNLERYLAEGKPSTSDRKAKRWHRLVVTRLGFLPHGRKSPDRVKPRGEPVERVLGQVFENIVRMDEIISRCNDRFPSGEPIADHPILGPLTASEWRSFHLAHGMRHVKQIHALRKNSLLQH